MLYNKNHLLDAVFIFTYIDSFTSSLGITDVQVSTPDVVEVCLSMRREFPHCDGIERASTFKKVANFVAWFCQLAPIKSSLPPGCVKGFENTLCNPNAVVAFDIAIACLQGSTIDSRDGEKIVSNPIYVSDHSYGDIIFALSQEKVAASTHYHLLAVFFEQLTYKSNRHCEYGYVESAAAPEVETIEAGETNILSPAAPSAKKYENIYYPVDGIYYDPMEGI